jgi:hypothetical protein
MRTFLEVARFIGALGSKLDVLLAQELKFLDVFDGVRREQ